MNSAMTDKKTIGLTTSGESIMQEIMSLNYFKDMIDAAKFAMSLAINQNPEINPVEGASTIWNVGSFDPDGELRQLIPTFFPNCKTPYRAVEFLIDLGLKQMYEQVKSGTFDIAKTTDLYNAD
jgi:hypothetical protein